MSLKTFRAHSYESFPSLHIHDCELPLLLTYSHHLPDTDHDVLTKWTQSEEGRRLYQQLTAGYRNADSMGRLALAAAALVSYRRLCPDEFDHLDQPVSWSSLGDLDRLLRGDELGNGGRIVELVMHALIRNLRPMGDDLEDLAIFLDTVLNQACPPLHWLEGLMDQYLKLRISGHSHVAAMGRMDAAISILTNIPCDNRDLVLRSR